MPINGETPLPEIAQAMTIALPASMHAPDHPPADGLPPEQRRWAIAAIFTALAMASLDTAIANIALAFDCRRPACQP